MMSEELRKKLKEIGVVCQERIDLKHAGESNFYIDIKKAFGYPEILNLICDEIWKLMDKSTTCIAASGYGGISIASVLSIRYNLKLTLVREQPKTHGRANLIDGHIPTLEDKVSIVDDVMTTGRSLQNIAKIVKDSGARVLGLYVVVKRNEQNLEMQFPLAYLFEVQDLLN